MKLKNLTLTNFRGIEQLDVAFNDRPTIIVGVNGAGKSTLLDALAISLSHLTSRIFDSAQRARSFSPDDIRVSSPFTRAVVDLTLNHKNVNFAVALNKRAGKHAIDRSSNFDELNVSVESLAKKNKDFKSEQATEICLPIAIYYDVHRAVMDIPLRVREKLQNTPFEGYEGALSNGGADFKRFFNWFRNQEDVENERIRRDRSYADPKLVAVRKAIELFTGFTDIHINRKPYLRMVVNKNGTELSISQLSNGEKCLLALVGDLARRLALVNPQSDNPLLGEAIVLIDEIDLHLHPKWQRTVVNKLQETFSNCQFIVSTHSPQIVGETPPENVLLLRGGKLLGHPSTALGLSSDEVLEHVMEGEAQNQSIRQKIKVISDLIDDDKFDEAKEQLSSLDRDVGDIPDVLRLRSSIDTLELLSGEDE